MTHIGWLAKNWTRAGFHSHSPEWQVVRQNGLQFREKTTSLEQVVWFCLPFARTPNIIRLNGEPFAISSSSPHIPYTSSPPFDRGSCPVDRMGAWLPIISSNHALKTFEFDEAFVNDLKCSWGLWYACRLFDYGV